MGRSARVRVIVSAGGVLLLLTALLFGLRFFSNTFIPFPIDPDGNPVSDESLRWFHDAARKINDRHGDAALLSLIGKNGLQKAWYLCASTAACAGTQTPEKISTLTTRSENGTTCYDLDGGKIVTLDRRFADVGQFSEGLAVVCLGRAKEGDGTGPYRLAFADREGRLLADGEFNGATPFSGGVSAVAVRSGTGLKWGVIDKQGAWRCEPKYDEMFAFSEGLSGANICPPDGGTAEQAGLVNDRGEFVLVFPKGHTVCSSPHEGRVLVRSGAGYQLADTSGRVLVSLDNRWSHVGPFSCGRACVFNGKRNGYIDLQGRLVVPPKYRIATPYINGTAFVR